MCVCGGQRREITLDLELQAVVKRLRWMLGFKPWSPVRAVFMFNYQAISPSPLPFPVFCLFEMGSHCIALAGQELT